MTQAVTELIVRADGALAVLDRFEKGMDRAGAATDNSTGAIADFERRMATARAAIDRGNAVTTESIARKTTEQRAWEKWAGTVDQTTALRIRLEREATQASVAAANAVNLGYTSQEQALLTLTALEQRHAGQLQAITDQQQKASAATSAHAVANDNLARSMRKSAGEGGSFQTANIAAQFQDIGVTAAMGMSPIMIALQQGTQLSSVLATMKNPVLGLATAFMSIINPVSLLTIGFVALGAAAIQWFMGAKDGADDAVTALQAHDQWLDDILVGYDGIRDAAKAAADQALRMPQAAVQSNAERKAVDDADAYSAALQKTADAQSALNEQVQLWGQYQADAARQFPDDPRRQERFQGLIDMAGQLNSLSVSTSSSRAEIDVFISRVTDLMNTAQDPSLASMASSMVDLGEELINLNAIASSSASVLSGLSMTDLSGMEKWDSIARDTSIGLSMVERAANAAAWAIANSGGAAVVAAGQYGTATGAANAYANAMFRLGGLIPEVAAAQAQFGQLKQAETDYSSAIRENQALLDARGISLDEFASRQVAANDLYKRATDQVTGLTDATKTLADAERQAAIGAMAPKDAAVAQIRDRFAGIDETLRKGGAGPDELARSAAAMNQEIANSNAGFEQTSSKAGGAGKALGQVRDAYGEIIAKAQEFIEQQQMDAQALGLTSEAASRMRYEQDMLNQAANDNIALGPAQRSELSALATEMAAVEERTRSMTEWYDFGKQTFGSFMSDFRSDLMNGTSLWDSFGNAAAKALDSIADRALSMAANSVFDMLFGSLMSGFGGGGGGFIPGLTGPRLNAAGNVYDSPSLSTYSNQIYNTPQMFAFAKGAGVFAEAGPEAIMPLGRDGAGRLGVRVANDNSQAPASQNGGSVTIAPVYQISGVGLTEQQLFEVMAKNNRDLINSLPEQMAAIQRDPRKRRA